MKIIARELLWFFTAVVIGLPVGYIYLKYLALQPEGDNYKIQEEVFEMEFFLMGWFRSNRHLYSKISEMGNL